MATMNPVLAALVGVLVVVFALQAVKAMRPVGPGLPAVRERTPVGFVPRSPLGWWSVGLAVAYALLLATVQFLVPSLDPFDRDAGTLLVVVGKALLGGTAAAAIVAGLVAGRRGDRSVLAYIGMALAVWVGLVPVLGSFFFE